MKTRIPSLAAALLLALAAGTAQADCYADYKAKQDNPLKLHYGVAAIPQVACGDKGAAADALAPRLSSEGWTLLTIISTFDETKLQEKKSSAAAYFLRY
ncbi:MAG: hypothetical protein ACJA06_001225 [Halocynthiibacter sp.]|jgi:hypothetical protein